MKRIILFFAGCFLANSIPHFVNGISGREFHTPFLYRYLSWIPSPLFNVLWGLLSFALGILFLYWHFRLNRRLRITLGTNMNTAVLAAGFVFASVILAVFFYCGGWQGTLTS